MTSAKKDNELIIEITSDFVCPWCYIGDTRLDEALKKAAPKLKVRKEWRPYELDATIPEAGVDRRQYMIKKFGSADRLQEIDERLKSLGEKDGIGMRPDLIKKRPNTRKAHRLMLLAAKENRADELAVAIFKAYFSEGKDIGDAAVLAMLAGTAGIDEKKAKDFLSGNDGVKEIEQMEAEASERGISAVPFTVIGGDETLHGALEVGDIVDSLDTALKGRQAA
jgi:predicted DsbA family dithiol-disulfide isomerase